MRGITAVGICALLGASTLAAQPSERGTRAHAQPSGQDAPPSTLPPGVGYTWSGEGNQIGMLAPGAGYKVAGTSQCMVRKATIDVTVEGTSLRGVFHQVHRPVQFFEATLGADGAFATEFKQIHKKGDRDLSQHNAPLGDIGRGHAGSGLDDDLWHVKGVINQREAAIKLEGSCNYGGNLSKR